MDATAQKRISNKFLVAVFAALFAAISVLLCACSSSIPVGEHLYENKDLGFSAYFPDIPTIERSTNDSDVYGAYPVVDIKAASEQGITEMVIHYSDVYASYFKNLPESEFISLEQDAVVGDLENFCANNGLTLASKPKVSTSGDDALEVTNADNYRSLSVIVPLAYSAGNDAEVHEFYFYELKVFTENTVSCLIGVRDTEDQARAALDSFKFV